MNSYIPLIVINLIISAFFSTRCLVEDMSLLPAIPNLVLAIVFLVMAGQ